jgi:exodeoxyribonuclease V alpha subunit
MDMDDAIRERLLGLGASTLHRLLGWRPGSHSRFRHDAGNRLPHDVVIVDETSMVSLTLMARLVAAVRPDARLILVGDSAQLVSIEAGAVLGDIVGPAAAEPAMRADARERLSAATGVDLPTRDGGQASSSIGDGIIVLEHLHRFGGEIASLARAVRRGDSGAALDVLRSATSEVQWIDVDVAAPEAGEAMAPVRDAATEAASAVIGAAAAGDTAAALEAVATFRLLCAHRRGDHGVETWGARVEAWLSQALDGFAGRERWYFGRPLLVTENDYSVGLYNGDTGVVVARSDGRPAAAFERKGGVVELAPNRLAAVETVYAMTIHKSQGSQFDTAAVLLPARTSQILTRELLYTAFTRARRRLIVVGTEETVRAAIERPVARASGLRERLWESR